MKPREFLSQIDDAIVIAAIKEAESRTSGEIRVYVSRRHHDDPLPAARECFEKLGMAKTRQRNAVLLYFVPVTRKFAVLGDTGVHEKCGEAFWQKLAGELTEDLHAGTPTDAIVHAVRTVGKLLATHFPHARGDLNELPDAVERD